MQNSSKGISFLLSIGAWGNFDFKRYGKSFRICVGFVSLVIFFYDVEKRFGLLIEACDTIVKQNKVPQ